MIPDGHWPIPCAVCGGYERVNKICQDCGKYFHQRCGKNHECDVDAESEDNDS